VDIGYGYQGLLPEWQAEAGYRLTNAHSSYERVELDHNATNPNFVGFSGSGLKAITEVEIKNSYVHDNGGNGLWRDVGCSNASNMANDKSDVE